MNVLVCGAHPDDIELMCGGYVCKLIEEGNNVTGVLFTDGSWENSKGDSIRNGKDGISESKIVSEYLGYDLVMFSHKALNFSFSDKLVVSVLNLIEERKIDTLILPWYKDIHRDHMIVSEVGIAASRRVPRVLFGQINYYVNEFFKPNIFIDITNYMENKLKALSMYKSIWDRNGKDWESFILSTNTYYGKIVNTKFAEGFISNKFLL